jgi:alcohol dehydrogenase
LAGKKFWKGGKQMKAVIFDGVRSVRVGDVPKPGLETSKDALLKVTHTTVCGSDLGIVQGKIAVEKDVVIGHEAVGVVEEIGSDVKKVKPGDRVVASYSVQCGACENSRNGRIVYCQNGGMFGHGKKWGGYAGTQAEYVRVPYADVVLEPIPKDVTEEQAIFVSDILSTGYMAAENGYIRPGDVVVVFGAGPVGCCTVAAARLFGPSTIVSVDLLDYRLGVAKKVGADRVLNAGQTNVAEEIRKMTNGKGADVAIEAVGSPKTLDTAIESVKQGGNISIIGVFPLQKVELSMRQILLQGLQIKAGRANLIHMGRLLSLIRGGKLDVTPLISHRMPLTDAVKAYDLFSSRTDNVMKIILNP